MAEAFGDHLHIMRESLTAIRGLGAQPKQLSSTAPGESSLMRCSIVRGLPALQEETPSSTSLGHHGSSNVVAEEETEALLGSGHSTIIEGAMDHSFHPLARSIPASESRHEEYRKRPQRKHRPGVVFFSPWQQQPLGQSAFAGKEYRHNSFPNNKLRLFTNLHSVFIETKQWVSCFCNNCWN